MKTRSSSGVGSKVDLKFNPDTLRIEDLEEGDADAMTLTAGSIMDKLKRQGAVAEEETAEATDAVSETLQLKEFLKNRK